MKPIGHAPAPAQAAQADAEALQPDLGPAVLLTNTFSSLMSGGTWMQTTRISCGPWGVA